MIHRELLTLSKTLFQYESKIGKINVARTIILLKDNLKISQISNQISNIPGTRSVRSMALIAAEGMKANHGSDRSNMQVVWQNDGKLTDFLKFTEQYII